MIREKDLFKLDWNDIYTAPDDYTTPQDVLLYLKEKAAPVGIPVSFSFDQVKIGNVLNSYLQDCLVVYHPEHIKDYCSVVITFRNQGNILLMSFYQLGKSKNNMKLANRSNAKSTLISSIFEKDPSESARQLGAFVVSGIKSIGGNKRKVQEENDWYSFVYGLLNTLRA